MEKDQDSVPGPSISSSRGVLRGGELIAMQNPTETVASSSFSKMQRPTEDEAKAYYYGLPSRPVLVARTSTGPLVRFDPRGYAYMKKLYNIGQHETLMKAWESDIIPKLLDILQIFHIDWTAIDMIRIGPEDDEAQAVPILWIGVSPGSTNYDRGLELARACKKSLVNFSIEDVECEVREANVLASVMPPKLVKPRRFGDPLREISRPLTATIGNAIAPKANPFAEGTLGFYIQRGGDRTRLFAVTCAHVLFPKDGHPSLYHRRNVSEPALEVIHLPDKTRSNMIKALDGAAGNLEMSIQVTNMSLKSKTKDSTAEDPKKSLERYKTDLKILKDFKSYVIKNWATTKDHVIGSTFLSPPVGTMAKDSPSPPFTRDWAVFEIDKTRLDKDRFYGNSMDLAWKKTIDELKEKMAGNVKTYTGFKYPENGFLKLYGTIQTEEMAKPKTLTEDDLPAIMVMKRGRSTGLTVGRANELKSFVRRAWTNLPEQVHKEWCIVGEGGKPFSAGGDSGAAVVDGKGRLGGLLTAGTGTTDSNDITYATPIGPLLKDIEYHGFGKVNFNPEL